MLTHPGRYAAPASPLHPGQVLAEVNSYACSFSLRISRGLFPFQGQREGDDCQIFVGTKSCTSPFLGGIFHSATQQGSTGQRLQQEISSFIKNTQVLESSVSNIPTQNLPPSSTHLRLLHLLQSARNILASAQNCNLLIDSSNTANYRGRRKPF